MTPWEIIEEALAQKRPPRGPAWLAEQLGDRVQVVSNWKLRGRVPPARYRDVAQVLGLTVDQLEGVAPLPWEAKEPAKKKAEPPQLLPELAALAWEVNSLPERQRQVVMSVIVQSLELARESIGVKPDSVKSNTPIDKEQAPPSLKRVNGR